MSLSQGTFDFEVSKEGYDTLLITNIAVLPLATSNVSDGPVLLQPRSDILLTPPSIDVINEQVLGETSVQLSGTANAGNADTTAQFSIGFDQNTLVPLDQSIMIPANSTLSFDQTADGLGCETTYSYQLTATNAGGSDTSAIGTVTTLACGPEDTVFKDGFE